MAYQSEAELELQFIDQLNKQGYSTVSVLDYEALVENFKVQFEAFNADKLDKPLTDKEWERILNLMLGKSVFQSAKILRDKFVLEREDGTKVYLSFFDSDHTKNIFQVTHQTTVVGKYVNRYDVTILVNGLPLIQVELKRRGIDIREAVNQVMRYKKHSYNGLYHFIQIFVVSNGVDTKYFANSDREMLHSLAFFWTDFDNVRLTNLKDLNISNTGAANLSPLAGLTNLTKLAIANPDISDLSPLSNLTNLTTLYLDDGSLTSSKILDLSPLASLVNMEQLYIPPSPNYTDFSPLSGMTKLREFLMMGTRRTGSNSIQSLSFLTNMTQLERIGIVVDGVDLSPIAGLTQLRDVELNGELYGENTSIFRKLVNMESLLLHASNETSFSAKDMSDFAGMKNLRRLEISIDELISLTGLEGLTKMESLTIYSHTDTKTETITTLEPLSGMTELRELTLWAGTTANVQSPSLDLSALGGLTSLEYVHLFPSTRIRDLSPVAHVSTVELD